jgi:hypothetical protein
MRPNIGSLFPAVGTLPNGITAAGYAVSGYALKDSATASSTKMVSKSPRSFRFHGLLLGNSFSNNSSSITLLLKTQLLCSFLPIYALGLQEAL